MGGDTAEAPERLFNLGSLGRELRDACFLPPCYFATRAAPKFLRRLVVLGDSELAIRRHHHAETHSSGPAFSFSTCSLSLLL